MHSVPTLRYPSGHWQVKAPSALMHCWLGWQSCSSRSHSSMSVCISEISFHTSQNVIIVRKHSIIYLDRNGWRADEGHSVPLICTQQLKISHHVESRLLSHAGWWTPRRPPAWVGFSLQVQFLKHSSCSCVKSSKFLHWLSAPPWTHTYTHTDCTNMLPPVPTPAMATCPSQIVAADNKFTLSLTHINMPNDRWSHGHLSTSNSQSYKPDTHPHSCLPVARSPEDRGWSQ